MNHISHTLQPTIDMYKPFPLTSVCREDLQSHGYDVSHVSDETMEELAHKMGEAIMNEFWQDLDIIAEDLSIPKLPSCSNCGETGKKVSTLKDDKGKKMFLCEECLEDSNN